MKEILENIVKIEHGFKHIIEAGDMILNDEKLNHQQLSYDYIQQ